METQHVVMDRTTARDLYREYKKHLHHSTPIDQEVMRTYQLLSQGRLVIKALESIVAAGLNAEGLPKLAIAPANATACTCRVERDGSVILDSRPSRISRPYSEQGQRLIAQRAYFHFPVGSFHPAAPTWHAQALVPGVPLDKRPKRALPNYHILWEAEWTKTVPRDPFLLRRIGKADLWLVLAMWELTEVERAVPWQRGFNNAVGIDADSPRVLSGVLNQVCHAPGPRAQGNVAMGCATHEVVNDSAVAGEVDADSRGKRGRHGPQGSTTSDQRCLSAQEGRRTQDEMRD